MEQTKMKLPANRDREFVEPVYTRKLVEAMGTGVAAAERLKVSGSTITTGIKNNEIYSPIEVAARYWWEREYAPKRAEMAICVIFIPQDKRETLGQYVAFLGGQSWVPE